MTRDRELVTDTERNRALIDIIENIKNCNIKLTTGQDSSVRETGKIDNIFNQYRITLANPAIKGIESFTALNHECWHILFDSQFKIIHNILGDWTDNGIERNKFTYYKFALNILEDVRIESLGGKIWLGTGKRFLKMKKKRGVWLYADEKKSREEWKPIKDSPPNVMLMIRFMQGDEWEKNKYYNAMKQALEDVELTGKFGSIKVMLKIKPLLDEWWEDNVIDDHKNIPRQMFTTDQTKDWVGDEATPENINDLQGSMSSNLEEEIKKEKEYGKEIIKEINDKLSDSNRTDDNDDVSYVTYVDRPEAEAVYNEKISNSMRKLFRKLSMIPKERINDQGNEIDVESFITNKIEMKNLNKCLIDKKLDRGVCLLLSVDVSASMGGRKISIARELVGTLFKSVEGLNNVDIKAQTWSSNSEGKITIEEIEDYDDVKSVNCGYGGETPTHLAIDYAVRTAKRMRGEKKLIIILTDGHPQYHKNNYRFYLKQLITMTQKSLQRALKHTPNIMCIHIGEKSEIPLMKEIFGSRFMHTNSMNEASERIIKEFKSLVVRTMLK